MRNRLLLISLFLCGIFEISQINAQINAQVIYYCDSGGLCSPSTSTCERVYKEEKARMGPYSGEANCYAYAFKLEYVPYCSTEEKSCHTDLFGKSYQYFKKKPQPGEFSSGRLLMESCDDLSGSAKEVKKKIFDAVKSDVEKLGLIFTEVSGNDHKPKPGNWLVALAYYHEYNRMFDLFECDYHWWRKNDDGGWSHKPGNAPIRCLDSAGERITDPQHCNRGKYITFLGYYEVGPAS